MLKARFKVKVRTGTYIIEARGLTVTTANCAKSLDILINGDAEVVARGLEVMAEKSYGWGFNTLADNYLEIAKVCRGGVSTRRHLNITGQALAEAVIKGEVAING